jgi:hypothetical protein
MRCSSCRTDNALPLSATARTISKRRSSKLTQPALRHEILEDGHADAARPFIVNSPEPLFCYPALDELTPGARIPRPIHPVAALFFQLNRDLPWKEYRLVDYTVNRKVTYLHATVQQIERFVRHRPFVLAFDLLRVCFTSGSFDRRQTYQCKGVRFSSRNPDD